MKPHLSLLMLIVEAFLLAACSPTKTLTTGQYMLIRNNVEVEDAYNPDFDNLKLYVHPAPNTKFLGIFNIKTSCYSAGQPKFNPQTGTYKDTKFKKMLRERFGEPPVLLDTAEILQSVKQLQIVMNQSGYFDATSRFEVVKKKSNPKKVKVNYYITAHEPYIISNINYNINIPEYKRVVILRKNETLLKPGMQYDESLIMQEITRILDDIRNEGYYYGEKSLIDCTVSRDQPRDSARTGTNSVSLEIRLKVPNEANTSRYLYKYYFNDVYIQTNYDANAGAGQTYDTLCYLSHDRKDSTNYYFITPHQENAVEPLKDFHYRTIANAIYSKKGTPFSQHITHRSNQAFTRMDNFTFIKAIMEEDSSRLDTVHHTGMLNIYYRLTRKQVHGIGGQIDLRNDKSSISFLYTNRNLFKGAEHLTINLSGGYFYYSLNNLLHKDVTYSYPEFGVSMSIDFPKLLLFRRTQRTGAVRYGTTFNLGVNYSGLYKRLIYNTNITYNWSPNYYFNQSLSPVDLSTINNSDKRLARIINYDDYPQSYRKKFGKFLLLSLKYNLNYMVPFSYEKRRHNMRMSFNFESCGLFLKGLNAIFLPKERWVVAKNVLDTTGYAYTTFEKVEFTWNYTCKIDDKNAFSTRFNAGAIIPLDKKSHIPYERGFYAGTGNSMRGWRYRGLGPGSYEYGKDSLYTGDIKIEWNLEYRGPIHGAFKFGVFADFGNIWLARKQEDMPNAEFAFNRFFKEFAVDVGAGLRLDFNFLVIRLDYAFPIYNPNRTAQGRWVNRKWFDAPHSFRWADGLKLAIGYAF